MTYSALELAAIAHAEQRSATNDKQQLRALGVVHTPLELVRFALRRVEHALREDLELTSGFATRDLTFLDPAAGTGVWLASLLSLVSVPAPVRLLAFERDAQVAERMRQLLQPDVQRVGASLTVHGENTLEVEHPWPAGEGVRLVLGNPPWGARSLSRGGVLSDAWLRDFHRDARGEPLGERRIGVLSDDYVRFFRWALEQARTTKHGAIVCFVSNASYLDGPVHRGMRGALVHAFDRIELLDLGGNALLSKAETRDDGLFPVRVGAALALCVRRAGDHARHATLTYARLTGDRASKLVALRDQVFAARSFSPTAPLYRFRVAPRVPTRQRDGFSIAEAFPFHGEGVQTNRDALMTAHSRDELLQQLWDVAEGVLPLADARHLDAKSARALLRAALENEAEIVGELAYRPFERRFFCRLSPLCHRPRPELARAMKVSSLCLLSARKELGGSAWNMFGAANTIADSSFLSTRSSCRTRAFPARDGEGNANLGRDVAHDLGALLGRMVEPEELIHYVLGVLGSPAFRIDHEESLKCDYARIPWPLTATHFAQLVHVGRTFARILSDEELALPDRNSIAVLTGSAELDRVVSRKQLRWLAPHILQIAPETKIGVGEGTSMQARVGHHAIAELPYGARGTAVIRDVLHACQRALMWADAEKQADRAYQFACSV